MTGVKAGLGCANELSDSQALKVLSALAERATSCGTDLSFECGLCFSMSNVLYTHPQLGVTVESTAAISTQRGTSTAVRVQRLCRSNGGHRQRL